MTEEEQLNAKLRDCATSCAKSMEVRKIKAHEVPIIVGYILSGLASHTGLPLALVIDLTKKAAETAHQTPQ